MLHYVFLQRQSLRLSTLFPQNGISLKDFIKTKMFLLKRQWMKLDEEDDNESADLWALS
jgi:hypothetical protein